MWVGVISFFWEKNLSKGLPVLDFLIELCFLAIRVTYLSVTLEVSIFELRIVLKSPPQIKVPCASVEIFKMIKI